MKTESTTLLEKQVRVAMLFNTCQYDSSSI